MHNYWATKRKTSLFPPVKVRIINKQLKFTNKHFWHFPQKSVTNIDTLLFNISNTPFIHVVCQFLLTINVLSSSNHSLLDTVQREVLFSFTVNLLFKAPQVLNRWPTPFHCSCKHISLWYFFLPAFISNCICIALFTRKHVTEGFTYAHRTARDSWWKRGAEHRLNIVIQQGSVHWFWNTKIHCSTW